jgi:hypothetical protein
VKNLGVDMGALYFKMHLKEIACDFVDWVRVTHYRK